MPDVFSEEEMRMEGIGGIPPNANDTHPRLDRGSVLCAAAEDCLQKGNPEEAESLFVQALATREQLFGKVHRKLVPVLNSLALLYTQSGRFSEAERTYNRALDTLEACPKDSKVREIEVLTNFGAMLRQAGRNLEAEHVEQCCEAVKREEDQAPLLLKLARGLTPSTSIDVRDFGKWLDQAAATNSGVDLKSSPSLKVLSAQVGTVSAPKPKAVSWRIAMIVALLVGWVIWLVVSFVF